MIFFFKAETIALHHVTFCFLLDFGVVSLARCGQGLSLEAASCSGFCSGIIASWSNDRWCFFPFRQRATRHLQQRC